MGEEREVRDLWWKNLALAPRSRREVMERGEKMHKRELFPFFLIKIKYKAVLFGRWSWLSFPHK